MDWTIENALPPAITTYSRFAAGWELSRANGVITASAALAWPAANQALYIPFFLPWPYPVRRLFWVNGSTAGGNWDISIHQINGTRIVSSGSTAGSGASIPQFVTVTPLLLPAGRYFLGVAHDVTTANHAAGSTVTANRLRSVGVLQQATALPLPATATFAAQTGTLYPAAGIARNAALVI